LDHPPKHKSSITNSTTHQTHERQDLNHYHSNHWHHPTKHKLTHHQPLKLKISISITAQSIKLISQTQQSIHARPITAKTYTTHKPQFFNHNPPNSLAPIQAQVTSTTPKKKKNKISIRN